MWKIGGELNGNAKQDKMMNKHTRRGLMIILSSPSGAGKTTLTRHLLEKDPSLHLSISTTTRAPRTGETEGKDYCFVTQDQFRHLIKTKALLEHAQVFDNFYGTARKPVETALAMGQDILFDIDWQGAQQLAQLQNHETVKIFILPPDLNTLEQRLKQRALDNTRVIERRMAQAHNELSHWPEYDYVLINKDLSHTLSQLQVIIGAERLKRPHQLWLSNFVKSLSVK